MSDDLSQDQTEDRLLGQAASEFLAAVSRGENPSVGDYAQRYPAIASLIEEVLPAVAMLNGSQVEQDNSQASQLPKKLGDFQIIQKIGCGGMGVVYEAEQLSVGRRVALKILPLTAMLDETRLERFQLEVRAAATLDHPHCVPIYAVGEDQGVHYYAMKLILGQTLAEVIHELQENDRQPGRSIKQTSSNGKLNGQLALEQTRTQQDDRTEASPSDSLSISWSSKSQKYFRQIAKLGVQAAEALHHAHERGIVHRDIKPSNLMLDAEGSIWITDFGLARIEADAGLTMTGDFLGTLRYMSPEQALGKRALVDHRSDIYSLGITLYELLALRPAIEGEDRAKILRDFAENEPPSLSKRVPSIPMELETIIGKAIEKKPNDRYATAGELADDLGRYLRHEPILAKRSTPTERTIKWVRRHPTAASMIAVSLIAVASVVGLSLRHASELQQSLQKVVQNQALMEHYVYMADINLAHRAWEDNDLRACENILLKHLPKDDHGPPGIEWRLLWRLSHPPVTTLDTVESALYTMTFSPQGDVYVVAGEDSVVRFYEAASDRLIDAFPTDQIEINSVDFSPDGLHLATAGDDGSVKIWNWSDRTLKREFQATAGKADGAKYLPDGKRVITWGKSPTVYLWDLESKEKISSFESPGSPLESVCLSTDGKWLFTGGRYGQLTLFDVEHLVQIGSFFADSRINCVAHAPKKNMVFAGTVSGAIIGWRIGEKEPVFQIDRADPIQCMAINSEEKIMAFGDNKGIIQICNLNDPSDVIVNPAHLAHIQSLNFTLTDKRLISCGRDGQIKSYTLDSGITPFFQTYQLEEPFEVNQQMVVGNHQIVQQLQVGSKMLLMLDTNHFEKPVWKSPKAKYINLPHCPGEPGRYLVTRASHSSGQSPNIVHKFEVLLMEVSTGRVTQRWPWEREPESIALSNEAELLAVAPGDGRLQLFDIESGEHLWNFELSNPNHRGMMICFSPDGQTLACAHLERIYMLDTRTGKISKTLEGHFDGANVIGFSSDSHYVACGGANRIIQIWNVETGQPTAELTGHLAPVRNLQFLSNDRLFSSDAKGFALWDIPSRQQYYYHSIGKYSHDVFEEKADKGICSSSYYNVVVMPPEDWLAVAFLSESPQFLKLDVSDVWPKR